MLIIPPKYLLFIIAFCLLPTAVHTSTIDASLKTGIKIGMVTGVGCGLTATSVHGIATSFITPLVMKHMNHSDIETKRVVKVLINGGLGCIIPLLIVTVGVGISDSHLVDDAIAQAGPGVYHDLFLHFTTQTVSHIAFHATLYIVPRLLKGPYEDKSFYRSIATTIDESITTTKKIYRDHEINDQITRAAKHP